VVKPLKTEEQLKADIFNSYSKCRDELASDRRQVYFGQLCDFVFRWCSNYKIFPEAREIGVEIVEALERIVKKEIEEKDFYKYLVATLKNARNEYYRKNISNNMKYPRIVREIERSILIQESNAGKMFSEEEKIHFISEWFNKPEDKAREYLRMIDNKSDDNEIDIPDSNYAPESTFFSNFAVQEKATIICDVVESVLLSKQERTRECFKALFTALCIKEAPNYLENLVSVLDSKLLSAYRVNGTKPEQYEVYKMYHPEVTKESAGVRASEMLKTLLNDLKTALKDKI